MIPWHQRALLTLNTPEQGVAFLQMKEYVVRLAPGLRQRAIGQGPARVQHPQDYRAEAPYVLGYVASTPSSNPAKKAPSRRNADDLANVQVARRGH